jgi:uncharacterized protein
MQIDAALIQKRRPLLFFLLVLAGAVPLWVFSGRMGVLSTLRIPVSDLALAFLPMTIAIGLTVGEQRWPAAWSLLANAIDFRSASSGRWVAVAMLIPLLIYGAASTAMHLLGSNELAPAVNLPRLIALFALFFALAAGEEVGWSGYAFPAIQQRWGALSASLIVAVPWWLGHLPSMSKIGATGVDMAWWIVGAVGLRIIMAWLYNKTGASLFTMVLFHASLNLSRIAILPAVGAHFLTAYQAAADLVMAALALAVLIATGGRLGLPRPYR